MKAVKLISDSHERLNRIIIERIPWLLLGLLGGIAASYMVSKFEEILASNISLAFFVPIIVYMSDAVGTQTEAMFIRDLSNHRLQFKKYVLKELFVGLYLGVLLGILIGSFAFVWIGKIDIALIVGLAMFINLTIAPALALIIPEMIFKNHKDPALGAGPFTTVIQDFISLFVYFMTATIIISFLVKTV